MGTAALRATTKFCWKSSTISKTNPILWIFVSDYRSISGVVFQDILWNCFVGSNMSPRCQIFTCLKKLKVISPSEIHWVYQHQHTAVHCILPLLGPDWAPRCQDVVCLSERREEDVRQSKLLGSCLCITVNTSSYLLACLDPVRKILPTVPCEQFHFFSIAEVSIFWDFLLPWRHFLISTTIWLFGCHVWCLNKTPLILILKYVINI